MKLPFKNNRIGPKTFSKKKLGSQQTFKERASDTVLNTPPWEHRHGGKSLNGTTTGCRTGSLCMKMHQGLFTYDFSQKKGGVSRPHPLVIQNQKSSNPPFPLVRKKSEFGLSPITRFSEKKLKSASPPSPSFRKVMDCHTLKYFNVEKT